ncbi:hypothetical protein ACLBOM_35795 [Escherichia coli]
MTKWSVSTVCGNAGGVPVEAFSGRSQTIREAVGEDASLKSRDVAALDTPTKQHADLESATATDADAEGNRAPHPGIS